MFQHKDTSQRAMTVLTLKRFLLSLLTITLSRPDSASLGLAEEFESRDDVLENEFMYASRPKRSADPPSASDPDKCSYTFIVPQRKTTGAICVNSKEPESLLENRVNKQELELLNGELHKQRRQIETLQQLVEVDGGVVTEVKLLRKESRNMNARVTQLYMQLLHEIIRKRDNALEVSQLENRVLNHTSEMQQLTARYRDLEHKYQHLASLANNQSALIVQLGEQCRRGGFVGIGGGGVGVGVGGGGGGGGGGGVVRQTRPYQPPAILPQASQPPQHRQPPPPPFHHSPARPFHPPTYTRHNSQITNEIQSDQNIKAMPPTLPTVAPETHSFSTDKPSGESLQHHYCHHLLTLMLFKTHTTLDSLRNRDITIFFTIVHQFEKVLRGQKWPCYKTVIKCIYWFFSSFTSIFLPTSVLNITTKTSFNFRVLNL